MEPPWVVPALPPAALLPAPAPGPPDLPDVWLPEDVQRLGRLLPPNEVALILRLVNKATAQQLRGPQHATVRLSQPVLHREFARRWAGPGAMRCLTRWRRYHLTRLTARSGSIANLELLLARGGVHGPLNLDVLAAAANAGHVGVCAWLREQGCPFNEHALREAAAGGHRAVCEWLLASGWMQGSDVGGAAGAAAAAAAEKGHVGLMDWLLLRAGTLDTVKVGDLLRGAAAGCDLPTLQRLHRKYVASSNGDEEPWDEEDEVEPWGVLAAAAASSTSCWRAKVEWLEARGLQQAAAHACKEAASRPDALSRLVWLRQHGHPLTSEVANVAAELGNVEVLRHVLDHGVALEDSVLSHAANCGHVAVMELLHARGVPIGGEAVTEAAEGGHLPALAWLVERLGIATALTADVFAAAAASGSMEAMAWLRQRGCPWDETTFTAAAEHGSEEQLEWLAAQGCPMGDLGIPYAHPAATGELGMLCCLQRLGCPWAPGGRTFTLAVERLVEDAEVEFNEHVKSSLCWLLDQGCPVSWEEAETAATEDEELAEWLENQRIDRYFAARGHGSTFGY